MDVRWTSKQLVVCLLEIHSGSWELQRETNVLLDLRHSNLSFVLFPFQYHNALQETQMQYRTHKKLGEYLAVFLPC